MLTLQRYKVMAYATKGIRLWPPVLEVLEVEQQRLGHAWTGDTRRSAKSGWC